MPTRFLLIGLLLSGSFVASAQADDKVMLQLRLKKGDEYTCVTVREEKSCFHMDGKPKEGDQSMHRDEATVKVEDVDTDGVYTLASATTAMRVIQNGVEYDSKKTETVNKPWAKMYADQVGHKAVLKYDKNGRFMTPDKDGNLVAFPQKAVSFNVVTGLFPDHPVGVGDHWEVVDAKKLGAVDVSTTYKLTLVRRHEGLAQISLDGTTDNELMKARMHGVFEVDEATGMAVSSQIDVSLTASVSPVEKISHTTRTYTKKK